MRYWYYKNNAAEGGPAGYWGDWLRMFFTQLGPEQWGGTDTFVSPEVKNYLMKDIHKGDVIVAYQTDLMAVVGFAVVDRVEYTAKPTSSVFDPIKKADLYLQPIHVLDELFLIHEHKSGTILEHDSAVNGQPGIRPLTPEAFKAIVDLSGSPSSVLKGQSPTGKWIPNLPYRTAFQFLDPGNLDGLEVEIRWWEDPVSYSVRDLTLETDGTCTGATVRSVTENYSEAVDLCREYLARIEDQWEGELGSMLPRTTAEALVSSTDQGDYVVRVVDDESEIVGRGASIADALLAAEDWLAALRWE
jgi:hypothetical protein